MVKGDLMRTTPTASAQEISDWENISINSKYGFYASEIEERAILKALSLIKRPTTALDIGCDGGRWAMKLANQGWEMICTDIVQRSLDICKRRIPHAKCIHVSPNDTTLPSAAESLGFILCIEVPSVIHAHWFIDEAFRTLQKGGLLVGVMWNRSSWRGLIYHSIPALRTKNAGMRSSSWYPLSYPDWRRRLCQKGFSVLYEEGYAWLPCRRTSNSPLIPFGARIERYSYLHKLVSFSPMIVFVAQKC
jgi:SAM-dependent methyltransferase